MDIRLDKITTDDSLQVRAQIGERYMMTKTERTELIRFLGRRAKAAKSAAEQRAAELRADAEDKLGAIYTPDDDAAMKVLYQAASDAVEKAKVDLAVRCEEMGIPKNFAPDLRLGWSGRGENSFKDRRNELRKMAHLRIEAMQKAACARIEMDSVKLEAEILTHGITSEAAQSFLMNLPSAEALMPKLEAGVIKSLLGPVVTPE